LIISRDTRWFVTGKKEKKRKEKRGGMFQKVKILPVLLGMY
jgi:hypothetical protein